MAQALKRLMLIYSLVDANQYPQKTSKKVLTNRVINSIIIIVNEREVQNYENSID